MRWTQTLIATMKESPEGAEIPSHILMLRAGLISQVMAGAYTYEPLGLRALKKAERIVREEMDKAGAVEILMPAITPISLWQRTGREEAFGNVLIKFKVRRANKEVSLALGPTHEEVVTDLVSHRVSSYRQLPVTLYQIQTKFRNEERPRFGVLRTSEFLMKDAYSFDVDVEGLNKSYEKMYQAYCRIFDRCGFNYMPVEAESGPIGGDASHEFMIPADNGEDRVVKCDSCDYAANLERAETGDRTAAPAEGNQGEMKLVDTPEVGSIEQVSKLLKCKPRQMVKTLIYTADEKPVAVLVRGDHEANEGKLRRALGVSSLELADPEVIQRVTGAPVGFAGPVGLKEKLTLWADHDVAAMRNIVIGANQADKHYVGSNLGRDFTPDHYADLRDAGQDDPCPRCSGKLQLRHAIEVGHVFKLGTKYSEALEADYIDDKEQRHPVIMGCYGIGINRIIAGLIETSNDKDGIIWPLALAPYEVLLTPLNMANEQVQQVTDDLYEKLQAAGVDVLVDDRDQRPGVKFKDADLIGFPLRITIGERGLKDNELELKWRWKPVEKLPVDGACDAILSALAAERSNPTFKQP